MAATVSTATLAAGYTQQTLADAIVAILTPVYGAPLNRYTASGTLRAVFGPLPKAQPGDKDCYAVVDVSTSFQVSHYLATSFTAPSTLGTTSTYSSVAFSATSQSVLLTLFIKVGEFTLLTLTQGSTRGFFGVFTPLDLPSYWNRASFIPMLNMSATNSNTVNMLPNTNNPYNSGSVGVTLGSPASVSTENPAVAKRDVVGGYGYSNTYAYLGRTSGDLANVASSGLSQFDTIVVTAGTEEYTLIDPAASNGKAVRTV